MKKALLIGIDYVSNPENSLDGCINDIIIIRNMLIDAYAYDESDIIIMRDDSGDFIAPTKTNIMSNLNLLVSDSENLEEIWFHYSGHGSQLQNQNSELREIIIPSNYKEEGVIQDIELFELIKNLKCRTIMVFDCCHSGSICDMPWSFEYVNPEHMITHTNNVIIENQNIHVFSGCRDNQTSADSLNSLDQSVGAFSNAFVESLRSSNHNINIMDLYKNTCIHLWKNDYNQNPILSSSNKAPSYIITKNK
jgi:uncharacterized caspase-like protein